MILSVDGTGHGIWSPGSGWSSPAEAFLTGWSCPTASFCVAVDGKGDVTALHFGESPSSGTVTQTKADALGLTGVSCASESFCLAVDSGGNVTSSGNPSAAAPDWTPPLAVDPQAGNVLPGGGPVLTEGLASSNARLSLTVACPAAERCVAIDDFGNEMIGAPPIAGSAGWRRSTALAPQDGIEAIACSSPHLCAAIDDASRVINSRAPTSSASTWGSATIPYLGDSYFPWGLACSARPLCLAWDRSYKCCHVQAQQMVASVHPDGGGSSWRPIAAGSYFGGEMDGEAKSCPWPGICLTYRHLAGQPAGVVIGEAVRRRHRRRWRRQFLPLYDDTSCPTARICFSVAPDSEEGAGVKTGIVLVGTVPASGRWAARSVGPRPLNGITCPSARLCFAYDESGDVLWSTHPRRGVWKEELVASTPLTALACPSAGLCVGIDSANEVVWSTSPVGATSAWPSQKLEADGWLTSVACVSSHECLLTDSVGRIAVGVRRG